LDGFAVTPLSDRRHFREVFDEHEIVELHMPANLEDRFIVADPSRESLDSESPPAELIVARAAPAEARWNAEQLLQGGKEAIIVHGELVYRLRLTRSGKLILYK
jgi:hemin uptake protein HemP